MKNFKTLIAMTVALVFSGAAMAEGKIAVLDMQRAVLATDKAQAELKKLQANSEFSKMIAKDETLVSELQAMQKKAGDKGMTWSDEKKIEHNKQAEYKQAELKLVRQKVQKEQDIVLRKISVSMGRSAQAAANDVIKSGGYGLVLNKAQVVIFSDTSFDITSKVTDKLNKMK